MIISKKLVGIITAVMAAVLVLAVGVNGYNALENRITRQLDLGYKYLEDLQYEAAAAAFEEVLAIDEKNMAAYAGGIETYSSLGDEETLQAFYDKAIAAIEDSEKEFLEQNMDYVAAIYLSADRVYSSAPEQAVKRLEEGLSVTERTEIKDRLTENYLAIVEKQNAVENYKEELEVYDRILELSGNGERVLESLGKCLAAYVDFLIKEGRYEEVRKLAEKYGDIVLDVDFDGFLRQIEELEGAAAEKDTINAADAVSSGNWVDDLYRKMIAEDVDGVFAIMEQSDFIEKCEAYPHEFVAWSTDYSLSTSDGKSLWVIKDINGDFLAVAYYPEGYNYGVPTYADGKIYGAPAVGCGDYVFEFNYDGERQWLIKSTGYGKNWGGEVELPEGAIWEVFHM